MHLQSCQGRTEYCHCPKIFHVPDHFFPTKASGDMASPAQISNTQGMRELQGPGQGSVGFHTDFSGRKKVKLEDGNSIKFKIKLSTRKLFCLSSQSVYAPLHKNRSCSMGTDASKHPWQTLTLPQTTLTFSKIICIVQD